MDELEYTSPTGETLVLIGEKKAYETAFIEADTLEGLVTEFEDEGVTAPGQPGWRFHPRDRVIHPVRGTFVAVAMSAQAYADFYKAWSTVDYGKLTLRRGTSFELPVRLAKSLPAPARRPKDGYRVQVEVISDHHKWHAVEHGTGDVDVNNWGDVPVWPEITWQGAGGTVTLPSGTSFLLPSVSSLHILPLDRWESGLVRDESGTVDRDMSRAISAVGEPVPVGETARYSVPAGASLTWKIGVFNPWA